MTNSAVYGKEKGMRTAVRLFAWVDFILNGTARDDNAYAMTFLALNKMRLLQVGYPVGRGGITMEI